ncbi:protein kinase [Achlya hypogyna]|uniref:non-specific serine/threonine protein kinase n=1 Tax=Achlya hypogyna TaxID=1202772 RepID=A0A1V9Z303_ACHHY|nr:protein kinase [Achlya hypogyna]
MNINRPHKGGLRMGNFFGTFGSPIRTSHMEAAAADRDDPFRAPKPPKPHHHLSPHENAYQRKKAPEEPKEDAADDMAEVATVKNNGGRVERKPSGNDFPAEPPRAPQIQLDVARKAKIPLFLRSPLFGGPEEKQPAPEPAPAARAAPAPAQPSAPHAAPVGRPVQSRNINFAEVSLGRVIGEGAFGKVHEGKWRDRPVAVKLLICQELRQDILEEFQSEVEIMSVLRHPNICRLLGACIDPPNRCLVVELLPRGSLWGVLRTSRSIDELMRIGFINDTAKGMSYLHNFQPPILHRDLKSPNLLVDRNYAIKISDFGLSRVKAHVQTMTGNCGTVQWMAPEVLGNQKYTEKADVFSFGIVIWECVTGECPYDGMTQIQAALGVLNRNLRPVVPKTCPPFLAQLMKACWARQPELRPSFLQIVSALRDYTIRKSMEEQKH